MSAAAVALCIGALIAIGVVVRWVLDIERRVAHIEDRLDNHLEMIVGARIGARTTRKERST